MTLSPFCESSLLTSNPIPRLAPVTNAIFCFMVEWPPSRRGRAASNPLRRERPLYAETQSLRYEFQAFYRHIRPRSLDRFENCYSAGVTDPLFEFSLTNLRLLLSLRQKQPDLWLDHHSP